ncbi:MAG: hypothetical protein MUC60_01000 [Oscillatoria sp. Prado101]|jgi:hypothetical protein|nr:hypothetical protein [Oscillatoria sp. Prado101]
MFDPISLTILGVSLMAGGWAAKAAYDEEEDPKTKKTLAAVDKGLTIAAKTITVGSGIAALAKQNQNSSQQPSTSSTLPSSQLRQLLNTPPGQLTSSQMQQMLNVPLPNFNNILGGGGFGGSGGC